MRPIYIAVLLAILLWLLLSVIVALLGQIAAYTQLLR